MIYINNSTEFIEIPRFSAKLGDRLVLINQITKVEISINFEDDGFGSYYRIPIGDIIERFETGQYDYYLYGGDFDLGKGILQFDDFSKKVVEYNDDIEVIQYTPDMEYTPVPDRVIKIENNGVYDIKSYDKADVDVKPQPAILPNNTRFENSNQTECPSFDYRNITTAYYLFYHNSNLVKIGEMLNTGNITNMGNMFQGCSKLTSIPALDTSKVTNMSNMFGGTNELITIPLLDTSNVKNISEMFGREYVEVNKLANLGGFTNMGKAFTSAQTLDLRYTYYLTNQSVQNIIDTVYDMNQNTQGGSATLRLKYYVIDAMSDAQKSQLAAKGWTLTN